LFAKVNRTYREGLFGFKFDPMPYLMGRLRFWSLYSFGLGLPFQAAENLPGGRGNGGWKKKNEIIVLEKKIHFSGTSGRG